VKSEAGHYLFQLIFENGANALLWFIFYSRHLEIYVARFSLSSFSNSLPTHAYFLNSYFKMPVIQKREALLP
jgi:hypothetical protein